MKVGEELPTNFYVKGCVGKIALQRFFAFWVTFSEVLYGSVLEINVLESAVRQKCSGTGP